MQNRVTEQQIHLNVTQNSGRVHMEHLYVQLPHTQTVPRELHTAPPPTKHSSVHTHMFYCVEATKLPLEVCSFALKETDQSVNIQ